MKRERSLKSYVLGAAIVLLVPLLLVDIAAIAMRASSERRELEAVIQDASRAAARVVYAESQIFLTAFRALADHPDLSSLSAAELEAQARRLLPFDASLSVRLLPDRQARAGGSPQNVTPAGIAPQAAAAASTAISINDSNDASLEIRMAVPHASGTSSVLRLHATLPLFSTQITDLTETGDQIVSIYSRDGTVRSSSHAGGVRAPAALEALPSSAAPTGQFISEGDAGRSYLTFWYAVRGTSDYLAISAPEDLLTQALWNALSVLVLVSLLPLLGVLAAAFVLSRDLNRSQIELVRAARAVGQGQRVVPLHTPLREVNVVGRALAAASARLEQGAKALLEANERLERRIRARTHELRQKSLLLQATLDSVDQGIVHLDRRGKILLANKSAESLFAGQILKGVSARDLAASVAPGAFEPVAGPKERGPEDSARYADGVFERSLANGTVLEIRKSTLDDGSVVCSLQDISVRAHQTEELEAARASAEEANRAKDIFLANMSHELRTPLNAILGYADLLLIDEALSPPNRERVSRLRGAGWGLLTLLNDVLDFSRSAAGELRLEHVSFVIEEVIDDAMSILRPFADEKGLALDLDYDGDLPRRFLGDPNRIRQILINLLNNAVRFTEAGFVRLSVQGRLSETGETASINLCVEDSGIGIPLDQQEAVFERFHQVDRKSDALHRGAGLGLAICRQLVAQMDGTITLRSSLDVGTMFTVSLVLPVDQEDRTSSAPTPEWNRKSPRILLADDSELGRDVAAQLLASVGLEVDVVANGREAVEAAASCDYDLVILDLNMPVMDGYEAARRIRAAGAFHAAPIVACSASPPLEEAEKSYDDYLSKPVDVRSLQLILERHLAPGRFLPRIARPPARLRDNDVSALSDLVGPAKVQAGLEKLYAQLGEILEMDLRDPGNAERLSAIAHVGLTSARLFGFAEMSNILYAFEDRSLDAKTLLSRARGSVTDLRQFRAELELIRGEV